MVALGALFLALGEGRRAYYTAPIKALVSEKFFELCREFDPEDVGLITGDATVNPDAPLICCTAEILAQVALAEGEDAEADQVVMDEFHYYGDRDRGVAWQIPLLTLPQSRFLLMSATLGERAFFEKALSDLTGAPTTWVHSDDRPVPLEYLYSEDPTHELLLDLAKEHKLPAYLVHFTQRAAAEQAQNLTSLDLCDRATKQKVAAILREHDFDTPYGKDLKRLLSQGVGVHHAGLLPKYRRLVERLAQQGLLPVICGTDTLGVGINVPIRSVVFTQLCKFDGDRVKILAARDFHQIAGRAGRKGFDENGTVVVQAPEHVIENKRILGKAGDDPKKRRKAVLRKPPERGYVHWDHGVFERLIAAPPEPLRSRFRVRHDMLLLLLSRPEGRCRVILELIRKSHESRERQRWHSRQAVALLRSLRQAGVLRVTTGEQGPRYEVNEDLQHNFSLHQALSLYVLEAVEALDPQELSYPFDLISLVEATLESPERILWRQVDKLKTQKIAELKAEGVEYEERMAELEKVEHPQPNAEFIEATFRIFAEHHPWVGSDSVAPKSIAREMYEQGLSFGEYVKEYGLQGMEGALLRYLSDAYKALVQSVPELAKNEALYDAIDWLGAVIRRVDSSLLDEWESLRQGSASSTLVAAAHEEELTTHDITRDLRGFTALVRNDVWRLVRALAFRDYEGALTLLRTADPACAWSLDKLENAMRGYWEEHESVLLDATARSTQRLQIVREEKAWRLQQTLSDPAESHDWALYVVVDLAASRSAARPQWRLNTITSEPVHEDTL